MKKKGIIFLTIGVVSLLLLCIATGVLYLQRELQLAFTEDAVHVISYEVHDMLKKNREVNDIDINARIKYLLDASVINICLDKDGKPVDEYGNPFRVTYEITQDKITVTCVSLGPDREEGTPDDIVFVYDGS